MWPPFFLRSLFLSGPTCRADHLREVGRLSGGLLICLLCVGAVSFCAAGVFQGLPWACLALVSADVWGKTQQKRSFMYIGGGAVGLWSQLTCICGGPRSPLHRGPSLVCPFWSSFSHGPKRLTLYFWVLWASENTCEHRKCASSALSLCYAFGPPVLVLLGRHRLQE